MDYQQALQRLRGHTRIVVTGPQRSGTTIATKMLAQDLGFDCHLENAFNFHDLGVLCDLLQRERIVVQAPTMAFVCHHLSATLVFMRRDVKAIAKSEARIGWRHATAEKRRYFYSGPLPVAQLKYHVWETYQRPGLALDRYVEIDYESLKQHPLWVPSELRKQFGDHQTAVDEEQNGFFSAS